MNKKQIARLKALVKKGDDASEDEARELETLKSLASATGRDPETGDKTPSDPPEPADDDADDSTVLSEEDIKKLVVSSMGDAMEAIGLDADTTKKLRESLESEPAESLTAEKITEIIEEKLGGGSINQEELVKSIEKSIDAKTKSGLSEEKIKDMISDALKTTRREAKKIWEGERDGLMDLPIEHRSGNLTVAEKQLLNICMMHVNEKGLADSDGGHGIERPKSMNDGITEDQLKRASLAGQMRAKLARQQVRYGGAKALTTSGVGTGAELVPTDLASELLMRLYMSSELAAEMVASEIPMPTGVFEFPMRTTRTVYKSVAENTAGTESSPGTSKPTLTSKKLIGLADYSYESDEDSIVAVLPMMQEQLGEGAGASLEDALINGDDSATHQDSDTHAVTNHAAKIWKGLRKLAIAGSLDYSLATGGLSASNINDVLRKNMGKYGIRRVRELLMVVGIKGYSDVVGLDETLTAEKVGSDQARILTGEAPSIYGIRIIPSEYVRENLADNGTYDGVTLTKGSVLVFHRPSFLLGVRRGFMVEVEVDKKAQTNSVIASFRRAFTPKETPSATEPMVVLGRNYVA